MTTDDSAAPTDSDPISSAAHRIAVTDDHNIVVTDLSDRARARARSRGGALAGVTLAVKDNIDVAGVPTTQGSLLYGAESALATAPAVSALESAGASTVAKVNLHEFAYGVSSANAHFGAVRNPTHPAHTSGGSSGGSAAAVAAGIARIALGTDTGGSVRIPAACVGVVGLRPRNGLLDAGGVFPLAPSFDTVGPIAATVADVDRAWRVLLDGAAVRVGGTFVPRGTHLDHDEPLGERDRLTSGRADDPLTDVRIGVVGDLDTEPLHALGADTEQFDIAIDAIQRAFSTAFRAEVARTHSGTFPVLADSYDPNVAAKLAATRGITTEQYASAMGELARHRTALIDAMNAGALDALATPVLGGTVPRADADELHYRDALTWYPATFSALNLPALAFGDLQLVGRSEDDVLALGHALEGAGYTATTAPPR